MLSQINRVELALNDLKQGKMIVLIDDPERENEGDLIIAAEKVTPETMNFLIRHGSGIVCVSLSSEHLNALQIPLMVSEDCNSSTRGTPFTLSIDAKEGITTGVSAADRVKTIQVLIHDQSKAHDLVKPGHIFPLQAKAGGVFERQGHTEGSLDLVKLAGLKPAAVLCEIMNPDGTMSRGKVLKAFAETHHLTMLSIDDIFTYRLHKESIIEEEISSQFPLDKYGDFTISIVKEKFSKLEHVVLTKNKSSVSKPPLIRIHSSCITGDLFASKRCDCHKQLHYSLQRISEEGGMLIYLDQEGRGIGLFNKIKAYSLQEKGYDTVEANTQLGLPVDPRQYYLAANILRKNNMNHIRLLTNNPNKIINLKKYGLDTIERIAMPAFSHEHNQFYLETKKQKMNHLIDMNFLSLNDSFN